MAGICSRRAAGRLIDTEQVTVNGQIAGHLTFVTGEEQIIANGQLAQLPKQFEYVIYNKPVGVDCVCEPDNPVSIVNQASSWPSHLFPVGRIDKDSHGLMLLTNDGELCNRLLSPQYKSPKRYLVQVELQADQPSLDQTFADTLAGGVVIKGVLTHPCHVEILASNRFAITLTQGLNRQIRWMAHSQGYKVIDLQRVSIGQIGLGDLQLGQMRALGEDEVTLLAQRFETIVSTDVSAKVICNHRV